MCPSDEECVQEDCHGLLTHNNLSKFLNKKNLLQENFTKYSLCLYILKPFICQDLCSSRHPFHSGVMFNVGILPQQLTTQLVFMEPNGVTMPITCCDPKPFFPVRILVTGQFSITYKINQRRSRSLLEHP
jgi:hypothetical protein